MADLIDRQTAIAVMCKLMCHWFGGDPKDEIREIKRELEKLPSVQPEIIRCKDCDWWTNQEDSVQGRCELMQMYPAGGWYCGNARRRQE